MVMMIWLFKKSRKSVDNRLGFTLAELIISVGTLAVVGILTIQFFLSAKDINLRSSELDHSVYLTNTIIESIKADLWDRYPLDAIDSNTIKTEDHSFEGKIFFDKDWKVVNATHHMALFEASLVLSGQPNALGDRALYDITLKIKRINPYFRGKESQPVIYETATKVHIKTLKEGQLP
jgi:hypothetical protein